MSKKSTVRKALLPWPPSANQDVVKFGDDRSPIGPYCSANGVVSSLIQMLPVVAS
jgi:hypothetical protein